MTFICNGYRWTILDAILVVTIVAVFGYFAVGEIARHGISLASVAGVSWGFGTLLFIFLYPFPIFGSSLEGERLKNENRPLTQEELRLVLGLRHFSQIGGKTLKWFITFFVISGGLALIGTIANR